VKLADVFPTQTKAVVAVEALVLSLLIGYVDYRTAWETSLFIFYAAPIFLMSWYGDRRSGILFAILSGIIWFVANYEANPYETQEGYAWATFNRVIYFIFVAIGCTAIRLQREESRAKIEAMTRARELEQELVRASEREQMRIGQDLHDGVCQSLAAIDCATECLRAELEGVSPPQAEAAGAIQKMLRDTMVEARNLARGLFPVPIDAHGLLAAVQDLVTSANRQRQISVKLSAPGEIHIRDRGMAMHLFRIAQEALNNAVRHAEARNITVTLRQENGRLLLSVEDDGRGLPTTVESSTGMGLRTMRYRAQLIGATLTVGTRPAGGTSIRCVLDLPA
jgi:signal transduction histidine kinase